MREAEGRYGAALELYRSTGLSVKEICEQTGTGLMGFRSYLQRYHRDLMFARHGVTVAPEVAASTRMWKPKGQTPAAHAKYREAVMACDDAAYIEYNVSQIAHMFGLSPTGLGNQLRNHFPWIIERRERLRSRLGLADNLPRGARRWCEEQYAEAVEHLRAIDDTVEQTAELFGLSFTGLRQHLLFYHKELVGEREERRREAEGSKRRGALTGNGQRHQPSAEQEERYREAVRMYQTTAMTQKEVAAATGLTAHGLRNYLRVWHPELIDRKQYRKSAAAKYAGAIARLKESGLPTAEVAREFGLNPETFRMYLHEHEPGLAAGGGMTKLDNGRQVLARSAQKYEEAIRLYETTAETLKSIAGRLGINYKSISGFIRRNRPDAIERHNRFMESHREHPYI